ncbi:hypothetical protein GQ55_8G046000 [Panicum hallii var. hallii]|uniref:Uncharacterized protein n=1 Tax=Panicum hallii var. hallii TaxID=1504633 RepID=A0A2T7CKS7_9POAL|nr:hypothetical protein GQ55_8G046000 [Panicum hallii var. hallii]
MPVPAAAASMRGTEAAGPRLAARRLGRVLDGRRRRAALLLLALAYAAAMLMLATGGGEGLGAGVVVEAAPPAPPGSVYRSHLVFERLLPEMRAFASQPNPVNAQFRASIASSGGKVTILALEFSGVELSSWRLKFLVSS